MSEVVILSSSPVRAPPSGGAFATLSSSPNLPSLGAIVQTRSLLVHQTMAEPTSQSIKFGFTSAASLHGVAIKDLGARQPRSSEAISQYTNWEIVDDIPSVAEDEVRAVPKARQVKTSKVQLALENDEETAKRIKLRPKKVTAELDTSISEKSKFIRKSRVKVLGNVEAVREPKVKAVRKPRAKGVDDGVQTKMPKGKVTKAPSRSTTEKATKLKKSAIVSQHFKTTVKDPLPEPFDGDLNLTEATRRRISWTPPAIDINTRELPTTGNDASDATEQCGSPNAVSRTKAFSSLLGSYGYSTSKGSVQCTTPMVENTGNATRKRKTIGLASTSIGATGTTPAKIKTAKKKPRTLTELATSAYAVDKDEDGSTITSAPLLQYFQKADYAVTTGFPTLEEFKIPPKPRSRSPMKPAVRVKGKTKKAGELPTLLSPQSALKHVSQQDFVFGTSSQLASEESPTLLKDLQKAMQASNEITDDPFYIPENEIISSGLTSSVNSGRSISTIGRSLWSASSRDLEGDLMEVEVIDLVETSLTNNIGEVNDVVLASDFPPASSPVRLAAVVEVANEDIGGPAEQVISATLPLDSPAQSKPVGPVESAIRLQLASPVKAAIAKNSNTEQPMVEGTSTVKSATSAKRPARVKVLQKPDYDTFTTAQLSKEIASYRFKPVKSRSTMITLLDKCWEGKQRMALGAMGTNCVISASASSNAEPSTVRTTVSSQAIISASPTKKPRGRPKKIASNNEPITRKEKRVANRVEPTEVAVELGYESDMPLAQRRAAKTKGQPSADVFDEISDSDTPMTPSPPRRSVSKPSTPCLQLQLSSTDNLITSPELSPSALLAHLHIHITLAVKSAAPSTDSLAPSWHEKILLYDPIILEDLTLWLNTGALESAGWDGEVEPKEVKKWCESQSICCLWRENLRGGARSRY